MKITKVRCQHCNADNFETSCSNCGRYFVLTSDHLNHTVRNFNSQPLLSDELPDNFSCQCDYCFEKSHGNLANAVSAALRQRTCPICKTEIIAIP